MSGTQFDCVQVTTLWHSAAQLQLEYSYLRGAMRPLQQTAHQPTALAARYTSKAQRSNQPVAIPTAAAASAPPPPPSTSPSQAGRMLQGKLPAPMCWPLCLHLLPCPSGGELTCFEPGFCCASILLFAHHTTHVHKLTSLLPCLAVAWAAALPKQVCQCKIASFTAGSQHVARWSGCDGWAAGQATMLHHWCNWCLQGPAGSANNRARKGRGVHTDSQTALRFVSA